jgi:hypothetical protein
MINFLGMGGSVEVSIDIDDIANKKRKKVRNV